MDFNGFGLHIGSFWPSSANFQLVISKYGEYHYQRKKSFHNIDEKDFYSKKWNLRIFDIKIWLVRWKSSSCPRQYSRCKENWHWKISLGQNGPVYQQNVHRNNYESQKNETFFFVTTLKVLLRQNDLIEGSFKIL